MRRQEEEWRIDTATEEVVRLEAEETASFEAALQHAAAAEEERWAAEADEWDAFVDAQRRAAVGDGAVKEAAAKAAAAVEELAQ